ncbi:MAG: DUF1549 domain-containing protein [Pedosphaera sp.]|nr:DUF1549 domain-containing protein [Pedosphaera sp.]
MLSRELASVVLDGQLHMTCRWIICLMLLANGMPLESGLAAARDAKPLPQQHWAFVKPVRSVIPRISTEATMNPIDAFIRARLAVEGIQASPEADRVTLIRRVSLDLTGLPPSPADVRGFLSDRSPDAWERVVERLLASPHFGERQARIWLDLARYADSNGYSIDSPRSVWPYRDWVIRALNADMPFDQFTVWQLAGDLIASDATLGADQARDAAIASGFHRNTQVNHEGGVDVEQFRVESVVDRVNTTATVWLGLTVGCAQCHDHKFDPISQREYYQLFAYFNSCENDGHGNASLTAEQTLELGTPTEISQRNEHRAEVSRRDKALADWAATELPGRFQGWEAGLTEKTRNGLSRLLRDILAIPPANRAKDQSNLLWGMFRDQDPDWKARRGELDRFKLQEPMIPSTLVMKERPEMRETRVMIKGDFTRPSNVVTPGTPAVLAPAATSGRSRRDLAAWLISGENSLTARVVMNRLWQQFFGRGLVETENDFGTQGTPPSHPELLDWLACELAEPTEKTGAWSLKRMIRRLVTSATYRQRSQARSDLAERDPRNVLLAQQSRVRLDAELIRDVALVASGQFDSRIGGPPVFPPQPAGLGAFTQNDRPWKASEGGDRFRRGIYTALQRSSLHPALVVFDAPDANTTCTRRIRSNTPLQSLTQLNDAAFYELARALGRRLPGAASDDESRMEMASRACLGRPPEVEERERLAELVRLERTNGQSEVDVWTDVVRVFFNLDETITRE